jgi:hypothetical protein
MFSEAAIGDALDEKGEVPVLGQGEAIQAIDCFSPHFQAWQDRQAATDDQIERHVIAHAIASWQFNLPGWQAGASDVLRLKRSWPNLLRMIRLREGADWTLAEAGDSAITVKPTAAFIRDQRQPAISKVRQAVEPPVQEAAAEPPAPAPAIFVYVDESRIADLRAIAAREFDLRKAITLCEELNQCYRAQCYYAVAALTRALIDHIPPVFGMRSFAEVVNNYAGPRSFKKSMKQLETAARTIADQHLHTQIRKSEVIPTRVQVDFSQVVDVLLGEIVRVLQARDDSAA